MSSISPLPVATRPGLPFYRGWTAVGGTILSSALVVGTIGSSFGLFLAPTAAEFQVPRSTVANAFVILTVAMAVWAPLLGRLTTILPIRLLWGMSALATGGSLIAIGLSRNLLLDGVIVALVLAPGYCSGGGLCYFMLISRWFERRRGRAIALGTVGQSIGGLLVLPALALTVQAYDWRVAMIGAGVAIILIVGGSALLVREAPRPGEMEQAGEKVALADGEAAADDAPVTLGHLLGSARFWLLGLAAAILFAAAQIFGTTMIPLGQDRGLTLIQATSLMSALTATSLLGKLLLAGIADRFDHLKLMAAAGCLLALVFTLLAMEASYPALIAISLLGGLAIGNLYGLFTMVSARFFGSRSLGLVMGTIAPLVAIASALAVRYLAVTFDRSGSYAPALQIVGIAMAVAVALLLAARRVRRGVPVAGSGYETQKAGEARS